LRREPPEAVLVDHHLVTNTGPQWEWSHWWVKVEHQRVLDAQVSLVVSSSIDLPEEGQVALRIAWLDVHRAVGSGRGGALLLEGSVGQARGLLSRGLVSVLYVAEGGSHGSQHDVVHSEVTIELGVRGVDD